MRNFQLILIGVFLFLAVAAVVVFSGAFSSNETEQVASGPVTVWGTVPLSVVRRVQNELGRLPFQYEEIPADTFEQRFVEALASGVGPDVVIIPENFIVRHGDKLYPLTFESLPERQFRDSFTDAGEVFIQGGKIYALPLFLDPLMMYWNRAMFKNASVAKFPVNWIEFNTLPAKLTKRDANGAILESAVALGGSKNISHIKEILSTLILQTGDPIVDTEREVPTVVLGYTNNNTAAAALRFYIEFANPERSSYSWNSSLPNSRDAFAGEEVAMYFGLASDYPIISKKNPHIDFDVATVPQSSAGQAVRTTFSHVYGVAIVKNTKNLTDAFNTAWFMAFDQFASNLSNAALLPPARRDLLATGSADRVLAVFDESAIISRTWLDPNAKETTNIFRTMVEAAAAREMVLGDAVSTARSLIESLFHQKQL